MRLAALMLLVNLLTLGLTYEVNAQDRGVRIDLPQTTIQLVASSKTGVVATLDTERRSVVLYPKISSARSLDGAIVVPLDAKPLAMCYKPTKSGGLFIIADDRRTISVIEDPTGKMVGSFKVAADLVDVATSSMPESPQIFYTCLEPSRGPGRASSKIGWGDVNIVKDGGFFEVAGTFDDRFYIEASSDGRVLYLLKDSSSIAVIALAVDASERKRLFRVYQEFRSSYPQPYVPLQAASATAVGSELRSINLDLKIRDLPGPAICAMNSNAIIFCTGANRSNIVAASLNTSKRLAELALPGGRENETLNLPLRRVKRWGFVDEINQNLLLHLPAAAVVIPLKAFQLPQQPFISVKLEGTKTVLQPDEPWTGSLIKSDKNLKIDLIKAPSGLSLKDDKLTWKPTGADIGVAEFQVRLTLADITLDQPIQLLVRQPGFQLPFWVQDFAITPDATKVLLLESEGEGAEAAQERFSSRIAVVDLTTGSSVLDKRLDFKVRTVTASNNTAYLGGENNTLYAIEFQKPDDVQKVFTPERIVDIAVAGNRLYVATFLRQSEGGLLAYRLPKLDRIEQPELGPVSTASSRRNGMPVDVGEGWNVGEAVMSWDFSRVVMLFSVPGIPRIYLRNPATYDMRSASRWGAFNDGGILRRAERELARPGLRGSATFLVDLPAAVFVSANENYVKQRPTVRVELIVVDLIDGREEQIGLLNEPVGYKRGTYTMANYRQKSDVVSLSGKIVVVTGDRLFVIPTKALQKEHYKEPVHFVQEQTSLLLPGEGVSKIAYRAKGGTKPYRFSLEEEIQGVELNAETGELKVNFLEMLTGPRLDALLNQRSTKTPAGAAPDRVPVNVAEKQSDLVEKWTGSKPRGVPIAFYMGVRVKDAQQQEARLEHAVVVDIPQATLQTRLEQRINERMLGEAQPGSNDSGDIALLRKRVRELELENARLKAQVDLLKELRQGGPTTRPDR
jgi:hypothetical protein